MTDAVAKPGWYPNPDGSDPGLERYWDGFSWTEQTRRSPIEEPSAGLSLPGGLSMPSFEVGKTGTGFTLDPIEITPITFDPPVFTGTAISPLQTPPASEEHRPPSSVVEPFEAEEIEEPDSLLEEKLSNSDVSSLEVAEDSPTTGDLDSDAEPEDVVAQFPPPTVLPEGFDKTAFEKANAVVQERLVLRDGEYVIQHSDAYGGTHVESVTKFKDAAATTGKNTPGCAKALIWVIFGAVFVFFFLPGIIGALFTVLALIFGGDDPEPPSTTVDSSVAPAWPSAVPQTVPETVVAGRPSLEYPPASTKEEQVQYALEDVGWWLEYQAASMGRWPNGDDLSRLDPLQDLSSLTGVTVLVSYKSVNGETVWDTGSVGGYLLCGYSEEAPRSVVFSSMDGFVEMPEGSRRCEESSTFSQIEPFWSPMNAWLTLSPAT